MRARCLVSTDFSMSIRVCVSDVDAARDCTLETVMVVDGPASAVTSLLHPYNRGLGGKSQNFLEQAGIPLLRVPYGDGLIHRLTSDCCSEPPQAPCGLRATRPAAEK